MDFLLGGIRLPLTPQDVSVVDAAKMQSWNILQFGDVTFPRGRQSVKVQFSCILPGPDRANQPFVQSWVDPEIIVSQLQGWCHTGTSVPFLVTDSPINLTVYVETVQAKVSGGFGDITCQVTLSEVRALAIPTQGEVDTSVVTTSGPQPTARASRATPASYTTVAGDNMWIIAQKVYGDGSLWPLIYGANLNQLGQLPLANLPVQAGLVLTIPGGK